jgi:phosphoheptose isomerase
MIPEMAGLPESLRLKREFFERNREAVRSRAGVLAATLNVGGKLLAFGNGGSAADSQRAAAYLVARGFPAVALPAYTTSDNLTFAQLYRALRWKGDCALAISTSGNSANVLEAVQAALKLGDPVIAFTGNDGGRLRGLVPDALLVPSNSTPRIQEVHLMLVHELCDVAFSLVHG